MANIILKTIHCIVPDETDKDEIYLKFEGLKIWPLEKNYVSLDAGEKAEVNVELDFSEGWHEIELWDFDYLSKNDLLGKFRFSLDDQKGDFNTTMTPADSNSPSSYMLSWAVR